MARTSFSMLVAGYDLEDLGWGDDYFEVTGEVEAPQHDALELLEVWEVREPTLPAPGGRTWRAEDFQRTYPSTYHALVDRLADVLCDLRVIHDLKRAAGWLSWSA